jgi:uncharacterized repeat protein (TIGR04076 family)
MSDNTDEFNEWAESVIQGENRYCQRAVITNVKGTCPFGHQEGDTFTLTALHAGGMCGALLTAIMPPIVTQHYGGELVWATKIVLAAPARKEGALRLKSSGRKTKAGRW